MTETAGISVEQFIANNFISTYSKTHIEEIRQIQMNNGYEVDNKNTLLIRNIQKAIHKRITIDRNGFIKLILKPVE